MIRIDRMTIPGGVFATARFEITPKEHPQGKFIIEICEPIRPLEARAQRRRPCKRKMFLLGW